MAVATDGEGLRRSHDGRFVVETFGLDGGNFVGRRRGGLGDIRGR